MLSALVADGDDLFRSSNLAPANIIYERGNYDTSCLRNSSLG